MLWDRARREENQGNKFTSYVLIVFLINLADAIFSYISPIYIEKSLDSVLGMGIILAVFSLAGITFDWLISQFYGARKFYFYLFTGLVAQALSLVIFLILPPTAFFFVVAMVVWGLYYEAMAFANFNYVHASTEPARHNHAWGILYSVNSMAYFAGPIIASFSMVYVLKLPLLIAVGITTGAAVFGFLFVKINENTNNTGQPIPKRMPTWKQYRLLVLLFRKVWPLWLMVFAQTMVEATYWSVGVLYSETLKAENPLGGLLIPCFMLPSMFIGMIGEKITGRWGKKKVALVTGIANGVCLLPLALIHNVELILVFVFISSAFLAISNSELLAVFEDYVARLGNFGSEMVSVERSAVNLGYIIGPIVASIVGSLVGFADTFTVLGGFIICVAVIGLVVIPRKIRMPQQEITEVVKV